MSACDQGDVVVAGLQLLDDGGAGSAGGAEPASAGVGGVGAAGASEAGTAGGVTAGTGGGAGAPICGPEPGWYWPTAAVVSRGCKFRITEDWLLRAIEEYQRNNAYVPSGEEREIEACDFLTTWFYQDPEDPQQYIVCPSKCELLQDAVNRVTQERAACMADGGTAP